MAQKPNTAVGYGPLDTGGVPVEAVARAPSPTEEESVARDAILDDEFAFFVRSLTHEKIASWKKLPSSTPSEDDDSAELPKWRPESRGPPSEGENSDAHSGRSGKRTPRSLLEALAGDAKVVGVALARARQLVDPVGEEAQDLVGDVGAGRLSRQFAQCRRQGGVHGRGWIE